MAFDRSTVVGVVLDFGPADAHDYVFGQDAGRSEMVFPEMVAALALQTRPERVFTRILQIGRIGKSGETYAIDKAGLMVSYPLNR